MGAYHQKPRVSRNNDNNTINAFSYENDASEMRPLPRNTRRTLQRGRITKIKMFSDSTPPLRLLAHCNEFSMFKHKAYSPPSFTGDLAFLLTFSTRRSVRFNMLDA